MVKARFVRSRLLLVAAAVGALECPAASAGPSIRELVEITDFSGLAVSPDDHEVVFRTERANLSRNTDDLEWNSVDLQTGIARRLGSGGDPVFVDPGLIQEERPLWLARQNAFAVRALVDGAIGVWRFEADGSRAQPLIVRDADVEDLELSGGGRALLYKLGPSREQIVRAERLEYDRGIAVDGSVDLDQNLFRGGSINGRMASQRLVGYWFIRGGLLWRAPRQQHRYDLASGKDEAIGEPQATEAFKPPALSAAASAAGTDGRSAEASWDGFKGGIKARLSDAGAWIECSDPRCGTGHVSWLAWRPNSTELVIALIDRNRRQSLVLWNVDKQSLRTLVSSEGLLSGSRWSQVPCAISQAAAYCVSAAAASPPLLERIDLETGERRILFDPNAAFRASYHPAVEQLAWEVAGQNFHGTLLLPRGLPAANLPLFVNYYRCDGFLRGGEGDEWPIPALLDAGFAVACINSAPFSGPQDALQTYRTGLAGVSSLVDMLSKRQLVDRKRVAIGGFSFGSEVAMWVAAHSSIAAAVSIASAQSEPGTYWVDTLGSPHRAAMIRSAWHLGSPEETPSRWKLLSPALNANRISAPLLMQLPEQEARRVPELYSKLRSSRTPVDFYAFPDEDHVIAQPRHRLSIYERNLDWFRYWLQDYRDPDPLKIDQYERWDRMAERRSSRTP